MIGFAVVMAAAAIMAGTAFYLVYGLQEQAVQWQRNGMPQGDVSQVFVSGYWTIFVVGAVGTVVSLAAMLIAVRTCTSMLEDIANSLQGSAEHLVNDAEQLANSSHSLADGASQQAASLEETSSSLEEMASMTEKNTSHAQEANRLTSEARRAADQGARDMEAMTEAMHGIKSSSDEVAQIVKTIDEIAFQTNILALNAAVEAARAGESGAGFAVVADEVRSLAQRSAKAANETTAKIENAINKTQQGVELTEKVMASLKSIVEINRKVDAIAAEVADASIQQSEGIGQLRNAVFQIDKVTQDNAAASEESASATRGLRAQAGNVQDAVDELLYLIRAKPRTEMRGTARKTAARVSQPGKASGGFSAESLGSRASEPVDVWADNSFN